MPWLLRKPFRYICHQWLGKVKGEAFYKAHVDMLGQYYRDAVPDDVERYLNAIPEIPAVQLTNIGEYFRAQPTTTERARAAQELEAFLLEGRG